MYPPPLQCMRILNRSIYPPSTVRMYVLNNNKTIVLRKYIIIRRVVLLYLFYSIVHILFKTKITSTIRLRVHGQSRFKKSVSTIDKKFKLPYYNKL